MTVKAEFWIGMAWGAAFDLLLIAIAWVFW